MPLGFPITAAQSPISAGGGTSGAATSGGTGAVTVGGLFGSPAASNPGLSTNTILVIGVAALAAMLLLRKR